MILAHALPEGLGRFPLAAVLTAIGGLHLMAASAFTRGAVARTRPEASGASALDTGRPADRRWSAAVGLVALAGLLAAGALGPADGDRTFVDVVVLDLLWVGVLLSSLLLGPRWAAADPVAALHRLVSGSAAQPAADHEAHPSTAPARTVGEALLLAWAAASLLWEPAAPTVAVVLVLVVTAQVAAAVRVGAGWLASADPLRRLSTAAGSLHPGHGGPVRRLAALGRREAAGPAATAVVLIGWALTDLALESSWWTDVRLTRPAAPLIGVAVLLGACAAVALLVRLVIGPQLAAAVVPLGVGWALAQHLPGLVALVQGLLVWLSDPLAVGADVLGTATWLVDPEGVPLWLRTTAQLLAFLGGHLLASAVLARRAAVALGGAAGVRTRTAGPQLLLGISLVGGAWLQLGGL